MSMSTFTNRAAVPCLLALVLAATALPAGAATNLLKNPGFEDPLPDHAWMPAGWDTSRTGMPSAFFGRDTLGPHGGQYSVNVANVSTRIPMAYNWSQAILVGPEAWDKDAVFTVWTRSNGLEGRAYILLQAYRDTVSKMAITWGIDRDEALRRLRITRIADPLLDIGWKRAQFSESETGWVKREIRVYVPPSSNMLFVRCGLLGTGQVMFDDASLVLEPALPPDPLPLNTNLLGDPGFEGDGNAWEYSMPPYNGLRVEKDETVAHSGKASILLEGNEGMIESRAGVCQVFSNRGLAGKRIRMSGWVKTDSLKSSAFLKLYCHGLSDPHAYPSWEQFSLDTPWTQTSFEIDVPEDTFEVWAWYLYLTPAAGRVHYDDLSLEVLGPATGVIGPSTPPGNPPGH
jgi:hypothetical protein